MAAMGGPARVVRGTSKIVPVVVSAGLAIGVFCGLLFGLGTGKTDAAAGPASGTNIKDKDEAQPLPPPPVSTAPMKEPAKGPMITQMAGSGSAAGSGAAASSGAGSAAVVAGGSDTDPAKPAATIKLTILVEPETAVDTEKIQIDGKDITGNSIDLPEGTKTVRVTISATGYQSREQKVDVSSGDTTVHVELQKHSAAGSPGFGGASKPTGVTVPARPPGNGGAGAGSGTKKKPPGNGSLIDI
jgi:hypothetical protein